MKKNNLFKISLLLLALNICVLDTCYGADTASMQESTSYDNDEEVKRCRDGVTQRSNSGVVSLLTSYNDISAIAGVTTPNPALHTNAQKAAWIFGYNQNMTGGPVASDGRSYTYSNGWDTGVMFNLPADPNFGGTNTNNNWLEGMEVCVYGKKIGWAFDAWNPNNSDSSMYFYKTSGGYNLNDIIGINNIILGEQFSSYIPGTQGRRNILQNILNSYNKNSYYGCGCTGFTDSSPLVRNSTTGLLQ